MTLKRLGVFGGTFNPIHLGHLRVAMDVKEAYALDQVWFVPSYMAPHKDMRQIAGPEHRLAMVRLAVEDNPDFMVSDIEISRQGPSYTIDTLMELTESLSETRRFFMLGMDAFLELHTWKAYTRLLYYANFVVMSRPSQGLDRNRWAQYSGRRLAGVLRATNDPFRMAVRESSTWMDYFQCTSLDISSTDLRAKLSQGRSIRYLTPDNVMAYINEHKLYC